MASNNIDSGSAEPGISVSGPTMPQKNQGGVTRIHRGETVAEQREQCQGEEQQAQLEEATCHQDLGRRPCGQWFMLLAIPLTSRPIPPVTGAKQVGTPAGDGVGTAKQDLDATVAAKTSDAVEKTHGLEKENRALCAQRMDSHKTVASLKADLKGEEQHALAPQLPTEQE